MILVRAQHARRARVARDLRQRREQAHHKRELTVVNVQLGRDLRSNGVARGSGERAAAARAEGRTCGRSGCEPVDSGEPSP